MIIDGWKYYNHAAIPAGAPHAEVDISPVENKKIWELDGHPLLARWTSGFDCGYETEWWYVIIDKPFDISGIKSKRRYEIKKGNKHFLVKEIDPSDYIEEIYTITKAAYESYPEPYRPSLSHKSFTEDIKKWDFYKTYGAFSFADKELYGYACLSRDDNYINFRTIKVDPNQEKNAINAALVYHLLADHEGFLKSGGYICDGERAVFHKTSFQDYLEKYFCFRKAYCTLHIAYRPAFGIIIKAAFPFRKILRKSGSNLLLVKSNALLNMEEIRRTFVKKDKTT